MKRGLNEAVNPSYATPLPRKFSLVTVKDSKKLKALELTY